MVVTKKVIGALSLLIIECSLTALSVNAFFQWNMYRGNRELATQYLKHFNSTIGLIYESELEEMSVLGKPYSKTFWLYSDNNLSYHALEYFKPTSTSEKKSYHNFSELTSIIRDFLPKHSFS